jgi:hypothetical protein
MANDDVYVRPPQFFPTTAPAAPRRHALPTGFCGSGGRVRVRSFMHQDKEDARAGHVGGHSGFLARLDRYVS